MIGIYKLGYDIEKELQQISLSMKDKATLLSKYIMSLSNEFKIKTNYLNVDYIIVSYNIGSYLVSSRNYHINKPYNKLYKKYIKAYNFKNDEIIFTTSLYEFENIDRILKLKEIYPDLNNNIIEDDI
jgi:hypothetical protein